MSKIKKKEFLIKKITYDEASLEVKEIFDDMLKVRKIGFTFEMIANNPVFLKAKWEYMKKIIYSDTALPVILKKKLQLVASKASGCKTWVQVHKNKLRGAGIENEELKEILNLQSNSIKERKLYEFTYQYTSEPEDIDKDFVNSLFEVGISEEEIIEVVEVVGVTLSFNMLVEAMN